MNADIITGTNYIQILQNEVDFKNLYLELDAWPKNEQPLWSEVHRVFEHGKSKHKGDIQKPSVQFEHLLEHHGKPMDSMDEES